MSRGRTLRRGIDALATLVGLAALLWLAVPSWLFLRPQTVAYHGDTATLVRQVPFFPVTARWREEMFVVGTALECQDGGTATYEPRPGLLRGEEARVREHTVTYPIPTRLRPCIEAKPPVVVEITWQVLALGAIPLRPVRLHTRIDPDPVSAGR